MRYFEFHNDGYYHIYNRGVDRREVFCSQMDFIRFITIMRLFNNSSTKEERDYILRKAREKEFNSGYPELNSFNAKLFLYISKLPKYVDIICYSLIPNHFHIILKQLAEKGIEKFMRKIGTGYTNFFNKKYKRTGSLFGSRYKAVKITTDEQLLYLSGYVNGNPEIHGLCPAENWSWSSLRDYIGLRNGTLCNNDVIINQFPGSKEYLEYVKMVVSNSKQIKIAIKEYSLE